ncbi:MAG: glycosyltransferase [Candidatus Micrarchaeota archaeon]|nr:glycosyltransferase [Candidatus Micrarchaeota archaeon]
MKKKIYASVIVPCYNSESTILRTLAALERQNFDKPYEVIVVDGGSNDRTVELVKNFLKRSKIPVRVFVTKYRGPARQRNFGAKKAKGEIIVFTDSDCVPSRNWLREMVRPIESGEAVGVQGTYRTLNRKSLIARFEGYEIEKRHERMKKQKYIDFIGTFSAAYRKDVFLNFRGFDTKFPIASGEDPELSYRIAKAGYKMVFNPRAWVYHPHPDSLKKYIKQKFYRAYWRVLMYKKHPDKITKDSYTGLEVPLSAIFLSLFFLTLLLYPLFPTYLPPVFLILFFLVNADSILFMAKKERKMLLFAPLMIFLRTFIWILGFGTGILKSLKDKIFNSITFRVKNV